MTLPYPHGSASGQIAHNSIYDTGYTPGSVGGKFIGFGEEGTSAIANRAHWALSANIDYLYQKASADKAIPAGVSFTASGSPGQNMYQFADIVFSGTAGSSDPKGMLMLFAVLDDNYNELTDGSGNEVRVKRIRESTGVTDVYKTGFVTNPRVYFCTVNSGGVEVDPAYQIPNGTAVRLLYGQKGSLENLPTDALIRFKVQSASEVEAGAFLQDGTKKMTGDADWDGHRLLNLLEARGPAASNLLVRSQQHLQLQGDLNLTLKDQYLSAAVPVCESGQSALYQPSGASIHPSIIGALNGDTAASYIMNGNRSLNRTGAFTPNITPSLTYPALDVLLNGQKVTFPGATLPFTYGSGTEQFYVYIDPSTATVTYNKTGYSTVPDGCIAIWRGLFNGSAWSSTTDLRWPSGKIGNRMYWVVGDGVGADFSNLSDLNDIGLGAYSLQPTQTWMNAEILILGTATVSAYFPLNSHWIMRGCNDWGIRAVIQTSSSWPVTDTPFNVSDYAEVRNIDFKWGSTLGNQTGSYTAALYTGSHVTIKDCRFTSASTYRWKDCIIVGGWNTLVEDCLFEGASWQGYGVTSPFYGGNIVRRCQFSPWDMASTEAEGCVDFHSITSSDGYQGAVIEACKVMYGPSTRTFWVSNQVTVRNNYVDQTTYTSSWPWFVEVAAVSGLSQGGGNILNNYVKSGKGIKSNINNATALVHLNVVGNTFKNVAYYIFDLQNVSIAEESLFVIKDNIIDGVVSSISYILRANHCRHLIFANNTVMNVNGKGIEINYNTYFEVTGNYFEGWIYGDYYFFLAGSNMAKSGCKICNNYFDSVGAPATNLVSFIQIDCQGVVVKGNTFDGRGAVPYGINLRQGCALIEGNRFSTIYQYCIIVENAWLNAENNRIIGNYFNNGINKTATIGSETDVQADAIIGNAGPVDLMISDNVFQYLSGRAIYIRGNADQVMINGNILRYVGCRNIYDSGGGTPSRSLCYAITCQDFGGVPRRVTVSNNSMGGLGYQWPNDHYYWVYFGGIFLDCLLSVVTGNSIAQVYGSGVGQSTPAQVYDLCTLIHARWDKGGYHVVTGNNLRHTFGLYNDPQAGFRGINVNTGSGTGGGIVANNIIELVGTNSAPGGMYTTIDAYYGMDTRVILMGNLAAGSWDNGNSATDEAFACPYANLTSIGNVSISMPMRIGTWSSKGMTIGNLLTNAAGSLSTGVLPASYTTPQADFNQKL